MSDDATKHQEDVNYQFFVLRRMVEQLPPKMAIPFNAQINSILESIKQRDETARKRIEAHLSDCRLAIQYMQFDIGATRRERDALQERLNELS